MNEFEYQKIRTDDEESISDAFCAEHGTLVGGLIANEEFDRLFDHLAEVLKRYGSFTDGSGDADFSSTRYVDQTPYIRVVAEDRVNPRISVQAGLEAVRAAPCPFAVAFDYYPDLIVILPPNRVLSTYNPEEIQ